MFYINAGPNLVASWHVIGEIFDRVYAEGSRWSRLHCRTSKPPSCLRVALPWQSLRSKCLERYQCFGDHAIFRIAKGAVGPIKVEGAEQPEIYKNLLK